MINIKKQYTFEQFKSYLSTSSSGSAFGVPKWAQVLLFGDGREWLSDTIKPTIAAHEAWLEYENYVNIHRLELEKKGVIPALLNLSEGDFHNRWVRSDVSLFALLNSPLFFDTKNEDRTSASGIFDRFSTYYQVKNIDETKRAIRIILGEDLIKQTMDSISNMDDLDAYPIAKEAVVERYYYVVLQEIFNKFLKPTVWDKVELIGENLTHSVQENLKNFIYETVIFFYQYYPYEIRNNINLSYNGDVSLSMTASKWIQVFDMLPMHVKQLLEATGLIQLRLERDSCGVYYADEKVLAELIEYTDLSTMTGLEAWDKLRMGRWYIFSDKKTQRPFTIGREFILSNGTPAMELVSPAFKDEHGFGYETIAIPYDYKKPIATITPTITYLNGRATSTSDGLLSKEQFLQLVEQQHLTELVENGFDADLGVLEITPPAKIGKPEHYTHAYQTDGIIIKDSDGNDKLLLDKEKVIKGLQGTPMQPYQRIIIKVKDKNDAETYYYLVYQGKGLSPKDTFNLIPWVSTHHTSQKQDKIVDPATTAALPKYVGDGSVENILIWLQKHSGLDLNADVTIKVNGKDATKPLKSWFDEWSNQVSPYEFKTFDAKALMDADATTPPKGTIRMVFITDKEPDQLMRGIWTVDEAGIKTHILTLDIKVVFKENTVKDKPPGITEVAIATITSPIIPELKDLNNGTPSFIVEEDELVKVFHLLEMQKQADENKDHMETKGAYGDIDLTKHGKVYFVDDMDTAGGKWKAGDKGMVIVSSTGIVHTFRRDIDQTSGIPDYSALTTQDKIYEKVTTDGLSVGDKMTITEGGVKTTVTLSKIDTAKEELHYTYHIVTDGSTGQPITAVMTSVISKAATGQLTAPTASSMKFAQIELGRPASADNEVVRQKEFKEVKDIVDGLSGTTFVITGSSFVATLAKLLEHLAPSKIVELFPTPTTELTSLLDGTTKWPANKAFTTWEEAIEFTIGYDALFKYDPTAAKGSQITAEATSGGAYVTGLITRLNGLALPNTNTPIRFNLSFRGYLADGTLAKDSDQLLGHTASNQDVERILKEFLSLTLYKVTYDKGDMQKIIDETSHALTGEGFQVDNIIKSPSVNPLLKFGDGSGVNQQSGVANSKEEQKKIDDGKANVNLDNVVDLVNAGKVPQLNAVTGQLEWVDKTDAKASVKFIDALGVATQQILVANSPLDYIGTDMIVWNVGDIKKMSYDDVLIYRSVQNGLTDQKREWILINPRHPSQGKDAFKVITRAADHIGEANSYWTEPSGAIGHREAMFMDFNFGADPIHEYFAQIGLNKHKVYMASSRAGQVDSIEFKVLDLPVSAYNSDELKLTLEFLIAWRQSTVKLSETTVTQVLNAIDAWYQNPTAGNLAAVNAFGYARGYLYPMIYQDVHLDTAGWSSKPQFIPTTRNDLANDADLNKFGLYGTKDADGTIHIFAKTSFASSNYGGHVAFLKEVEIEDAEIGHQQTTIGGLQTIRSDIKHNTGVGKTNQENIEKKVETVTSKDSSVTISKSTDPTTGVTIDLSVKPSLNVISSDATVLVSKSGNDVDLSVAPPLPINDSDEIENGLNGDYVLTQAYKDKVAKAIKDADDAAKVIIDKEIADADKALDDKIDKEKVISDSKSLDNHDDVINALKAYGNYEKVSTITKFVSDPNNIGDSLAVDMKTTLLQTFKWTDGESLFIKVTTPPPYNGHGSGVAIVGDAFGASIIVSGETKDENATPATFSVVALSNGTLTLKSFIAGTTGLTIDDIKIEGVGQTVIDKGLPGKVAANEQGVIDANKLVGGIVDALNLAKIYEMAKGGTPAAITQVGTSDIYKGVEHTFSKDYADDSKVLIKLENGQLITVNFIKAEGDIAAEHEKVDLPGGSGDHIHIAVLKKEAVPNTVPKTYTYQIIIDDAHKAFGSPGNINTALGYTEIVSTTETPAPVDLSAYDTAAATALKISGAIAAHDTTNSKPALARKMNVSMDNFAGITIPGYDATKEQKLVKDATGAIKLVEDAAGYKIYGNKLTLDIATGMKDDDVAYVKSEHKWYIYDLANTKWVTSDDRGMKIYTTKITLDLVTGKANDLAYVTSEDAIYRWDITAQPNPKWVTHELDDTKVMAAVNQAFGSGTTVTGDVLLNPSIKWVVTGAKAGTIEIKPNGVTGEPEIFVDGVKTVALRDVR